MISQQTINLIQNVTGIDITKDSKTWKEIEAAIPANSQSLQAQQLRKICRGEESA